MKRAAVFVIPVLCGCTRPGPPAPTTTTTASTTTTTTTTTTANTTTTTIPSATSPLPKQIDPDGDDLPVDTGSGAAPAHGRFAKVGKAPLSLWRVCDLTPFHGALYAAHATQPLGLDGATISRYRDGQFEVAFDWNRPGEPTQGGGAGQGFLRVHAFDVAGTPRLFVTDADPPYAGLGLIDHGTEGYVFVSDPDGAFAKARAPGHRPPAFPTLEGIDGGAAAAGASVVPRAYPVIDVIAYRHRFYTSTGSVPPDARAWSGPSPGALHVASADLSRFTYETDFPYPYPGGVWRLTYMVRFKDRLYAGIQDYDGQSPDDYVYFAPRADAPGIGHDDAHPANVSGLRGTATLRWYADGGRLFWLAWQRDGDVVLRVTKDGDAWTRVALPPDSGRPTDVTRFRGALFVLTERKLFRLDENDQPAEVAEVPAEASKKSPFELKDVFCAAPLAVFENRLYAGAQHDGALWALEED